MTPELMPLQGVTYPLKVEVKHPFLILQNLKQRDSLFHVYDLRNGELKSAFGITGDGPEDFVLPCLLHTPLRDILIEDLNTSKIYRFGISGEGKPAFKGAQRMNYTENVLDPAFINDSLFVIDARYYVSTPALHLLSLTDEQPRKTLTYRKPDRGNSLNPDRAEVYASESRIVLISIYRKRIDFMDTDFHRIQRVEFEYDPPSFINREDPGEAKMSYIYTYLGKRYLYAVFSGVSMKEHKAASTRGTFLEVFDLDGNPVARYLLNGKSPVFFAVDEETFTLYGAGYDGDPEDYLLVYTLKGLS
ncbi:MAG: TolB-like 6-bladed beta-propeller domain-containing protein [Tannerella sp.]|nr:TolB-like 6-bladed beta-propeller domain-containing protein [Tannerella sp.]